MSDLEIDRARKQAHVDRILSLAAYQKQLKLGGAKQPRFSDILNLILREFRIRNVEVPTSFPIGLAKQLRGVRLTVKADPFFPQREIKTPAEVAKLADAMRLAEEGMQSAVNVLRKSRIGRDGFLYWRGKKLTAEDVQGVINATIAGLGGIASHTIVACGNQGCDPHDDHPRHLSARHAHRLLRRHHTNGRARARQRGCEETLCGGRHGPTACVPQAARRRERAGCSQRDSEALYR
jgi:Xaa-Pro aminopeptidase